MTMPLLRELVLRAFGMDDPPAARLRGPHKKARWPRILSPWAIAAAVTFAAGADASQASAVGGTKNCFVLANMWSAPPAEGPFSAADIARMRRHFLANLNVRGTGAVIASPGDTPSLDIYNIPGGYRFDWQRDGALSIGALIKVAQSDVGTLGDEAQLLPETVTEITRAYVKWVKLVVSKDGQKLVGRPGTIDSHGEPKWEIDSAVPWSGHWCRPQFDGPALRAKTLMLIANSTDAGLPLNEVWELIKFDLDWLAREGNVYLESCDLWEETRDPNLFWNRMAMRGALIMGSYVARGMNDAFRAETYTNTALKFVRNPAEDHQQHTSDGGVFISECATTAPAEGPCLSKKKDIDGAVILGLIHSGWLDYTQPPGLSLEPAASPTSEAVANTVRVHVERFCEAYSINRKDTLNHVPGVLLGRYPADVYGGGNPWVLITAALASLLYQAAQAVAWEGPVVSPAQLAAWRAALAAPLFDASARAFVAAGDSVLARLKKHVMVDGFHLYEQIGKDDGLQFNAKDLTWSYAETLSALRERSLAMQWIEAVARRLQVPEAQSASGLSNFTSREASGGLWI